MGDGLAEILELDSKQTPVNGDSVAKSSHGQAWVVTLVNLLTVPLGYGYLSDLVVGNTKTITVNARARLHHYAESIASSFNNLMERKDRHVERITASRQLRKSGYIVMGNEIYYPIETRIDGRVVDRKEQLIGRLVFDGHYNRAEVLWEHHNKVERKLRESGYVSVTPVNKI